MSLDLLELFFGLLILCSLEHSFRQAAKQKERTKYELLFDEVGTGSKSSSLRNADVRSSDVRNSTDRPQAVIAPSKPMASMDAIKLLAEVAPAKRRRVRVSSLPIYRSKELDEALQEVRTS